ncbi:hypothetical protein [Marinobacter daepoensis]|uniref:hypothetical protein n=1 Tax=Marinobacter daepoensis TaxID=262077 RepID=UPI0004A4FE60|nr:hypothetical protein [Marinobacter daepoensis]
MSAIGTKTFFFFSGDQQPHHYTLEHPDYFQHPDLRLPKRGITLLYGNKGPGSLIGAAVRESAASGQGVCFADVKVEIGEWHNNKQKLATFESCRFLNLPLRANKEILDDVNQHWNKWLDEEFQPREDFPRKPSNRMDLLDRLIDLEPYKHLNAIAYDANTRFGLAKFVTVFNLDAILYDEISVIPPQTKLTLALPQDS